MLPDSSPYVAEFFGLPAHALLVHGAVVLLPLCAIGVILLAFIGAWRRKYGWLVLFGLFLATMFAYFAKESGESLAEAIGRPERHADLGTWLPIVAVVLFLLTLIWLPLARNGDRPVSKAATTSVSGDATQVLAPTATAPRGPGGFTRFMALLAVIAAVTTLVWTIMVGHSGATAVWGDVVNPSPTPSPTSPSPSPTPTQSSSPSPTASPSRSPSPTGVNPSPTRSRLTPSPTRSFPSVSPNAATESPLFSDVLPEDQLDPASP